MALISCADCGLDVSSTAKACLACGAPTPRAIAERNTMLEWIKGAIWLCAAAAILTAGIMGIDRWDAETKKQVADETKRQSDFLNNQERIRSSVSYINSVTRRIENGEATVSVDDDGRKLVHDKNGKLIWAQ